MDCGNSVGGLVAPQIFKELGIKLIDNTPEEITDVVMEMDSRINGTWVVNDEEEDLQNKFWSLFKHKFLKSPTFRIGSKFLRQTQNQ